MQELDRPIETLSRIPRPYISKVKKLGVKTLRDLLFYLPYKYENFGEVVNIKNVKVGQNNCVQGVIEDIKGQRSFFRKVHITTAIVKDDTGKIECIWFGQSYLDKTLKPGDIVSIAGKVALGKKGLYFSAPAYEKTSQGLFADKHGLTHTAKIVPIYSQTVGLSSRWLRFILKPLLEEYRFKLEETLPKELLNEMKFMPLNEALWQAHFPETLEKAQEAKRRFEFEEMFILQLAVLREKQRMLAQSAPTLPIKLERIQLFISDLPFTLTDDQKKVIWRILKDTEKSSPMSRLLQGDVGSGKTVVAAIVALNAIKNGYQAAFMAPTEILARQHFSTLSKVFKGFDANIGFLTGKSDEFVSKKLRGQPIEISRKKLLEKTEKGELDILVGTHALIKGKVKFKNLALAVIDEQHRFGVEQRANLVKTKGAAVSLPHFLSMTATPIPRSLALTIYGDLDLSIIKTMPHGRKEIITKIISEKEREEMYKFIGQEIENGRQAFVICPRIDEGETDNQPSEAKSLWADVKNVTAEAERLQKEVFPNYKIGLLHGKLSSTEKEKVMLDFKNNKTNILVSTSVVEVGIDVPNATVMMIEGADRFGLAQLHQFRGRVGRSEYQSYCFLLLSSANGKSLARAKAMVDFASGFDISKKDLQIRGPGELAGGKQSGMPDIIMEQLQDISKVEKTREMASSLLENDPELKKFPALLARTITYRERLHLE
ncbi:MAG: ATP-dependent DNA helicase RecG [Candidatus Paceibacterota bacterium]